MGEPENEGYTIHVVGNHAVHITGPELNASVIYHGDKGDTITLWVEDPDNRNGEIVLEADPGRVVKGQVFDNIVCKVDNTDV